jgi:DNA-binding transcriptional ArsR family regulator
MKKRSSLDIKKLDMAASRLRAMAHPMRIAIIELLNENKRLNVTEIYERLSIEQASASHHLNILKNKGLLESKREGKMILYSLKTESLANVINCINQCAAAH